VAKPITICAGIDTGKRKLDVALDGSKEQLQVENTAEGHKVLLRWLHQHRVKRVGIEASGGYEQPVVSELRRMRIVVVVFQPAQVRAYAKFQLQRAKNDKIDAALIAACTAAVRKIHAAPDPRLQPFAEQLTMIDQIGEDIGSDCRPPSPSWSVCPRSAGSHASKQPLSRDLRLMTTTAASTSAFDISRADESGCGAPFIRRHWRHHFAGTRSSSRFIKG